MHQYNYKELKYDNVIKKNVQRMMGMKTGTLHLGPTICFNYMQIYRSNFTIFLKGKQSYFVFLINTNSFSPTLETRVC